MTQCESDRYKLLPWIFGKPSSECNFSFLLPAMLLNMLM